MLRARERANAIAAIDDTQYANLLRYLAANLANEQDAQDLAQEAYLRLLRASHARILDNPVAYLFRIAQNLLYEWLKSRPPPNEPLREWLLVSNPTVVEDAVALAQQMQRLEHVLGQLPPNCRAAVLMHRRDGMTYNEIADALGVSSAMVKKYLSQGLARCRRDMRKFHES